MKMQLGFKGGERERERERRERSNAARRARIVGPKKRREKKKDLKARCWVFCPLSQANRSDG